MSVALKLGRLPCISKLCLSCHTATGVFFMRRSTSDNVQVKIQPDTGLALLTLAQPPVNSLSGDFMSKIAETTNNLGKDSSVTGILISSKFHGKVFSSGLDLHELCNKTDKQVGEFWRCVQEWCLSTYSCSKPMVAAINGHAPAGGCMYALMCDYRVMTASRTIGVTATSLGLFAPPAFSGMMRNAVGTRNAELALMRGQLFTSEDALEIGLVDKVTDLDSVVPEAMDELTRLSKIPQPAFAITKNYFRNDKIKKLRDSREREVTEMVKHVQRPDVQKSIERHLHNLKLRKK